MSRERESANRRRVRALTAAIGAESVVVVQEDLLERWLAARQRHHALAREGDYQRTDIARDLEPHRVRPRGGCRDTGQRVQVRDAPGERHLDRLRVQVL